MKKEDSIPQEVIDILNEHIHTKLNEDGKLEIYFSSPTEEEIEKVSEI